jgi:hypothetical protein
VFVCQYTYVLYLLVSIYIGNYVDSRYSSTHVCISYKELILDLCLDKSTVKPVLEEFSWLNIHLYFALWYFQVQDNVT